MLGLQVIDESKPEFQRNITQVSFAGWATILAAVKREA